MRSVNRKPKQIEHFFKILNQELKQKAKIILTGAAAASLWGNIRPSLDIDFAVELEKQQDSDWQQLEKAILVATQKTGIHADFAEDIDRWGLISLMDYKKHVIAYRNFGLLKVMVLEPIYWSIGKMNRYLNPDIKDMFQVFKRQKISCSKLCQIWGKALKSSPRSAALHQFKAQVEHFLKNYGQQIWGKNLKQEELLQIFYQAAGLKLKIKK